MNHKGFTLIEILVYMSVSSLILTSLLSFAWSMIDADAKIRAAIDSELQIIYQKRIHE
jgi:prepilin-type N-terminal cleavage/methylation domain-containing protein